MKDLFSLIWSLVLLLLVPVVASATHIVGGEMTYECLGNNQYRITMRVYRDCFSGQAGFDGSGPGSTPARVTIFLGSGPSAQQMGTPNIGNPVITKIDPVVTNPCLTAPSNVCVEQGVYTFTVNLTPTNQSYFIAYQRCCRNGTISNIVTPGDYGATYAVEITPLAQQECNSSPTFNDFPPIAICVNDTLRFDHSATDVDGDSLVYSFCTPLEGGSKNNVAPNPESKPPYDGVTFLFPFTQDNPLGGNPPVTIDPVTGEIFGFPAIQGQYVVGVCVTEYRNGVKLSTTQRDFQFNVVACVQAINAEIEIPADILYGGKALICGKSVMTLINKSTPLDKIADVAWLVDTGSLQPVVLQTSDTLQMTFPQPGLYTGVLVANPGLSCTDTTTIEILVTPELEGSMTVTGDSCLWDPFTFTAQVNRDPAALEGITWDFKNGQEINGNPVNYAYPALGVYAPSFTAVDTFGCERTITRILDWFPLPDPVAFTNDPDMGCLPLEVQFINTSTPLTAEYLLDWDFGDGATGQGTIPRHTYMEPGSWDVGLTITSPFGCQSSILEANRILTRFPVVADFSFLPAERINEDNPLVLFKDESAYGEFFQWTIPGEYSSTAPSMSYSFPDIGIYEVILEVTNLAGCYDSIVRYVEIEPVYRIYAPTAFSPNVDGFNDGFRLLTSRGLDNMLLQVYDRWGNLVFQTRDDEAEWDGQLNGRPLDAGIYVWQVQYVDYWGETKQVQGEVQVVR
ncbi:MAG: gliding motility-associated C-terminal domain-containing protein [Lewinellaceae bacterium]|nr:gliding motility-associated C-terminal domain-containing protein [Saprospiraceae bacterium]MCB9312382.1 gliding motility-associated C-terminal domain-containing protein [Lewinellaceae bacterium]